MMMSLKLDYLTVDLVQDLKSMVRLISQLLFTLLSLI